jgi:SPP1 gp7 family putative phage head morphogenesis protein
MAQAKTEVKKSDFAANIPNDEFLEFLEMETYKYIGDWSYSITKKSKDELIKAIKDGKPLSSVISVLDDEGKRLSDVSIERYSRTKTTEVFNKGRMEYFESTGVVAAYQYSAIMDDVTSEICSELNGLVFEKDEAPIPPNHFNCRSVLIPITRFEEYKADSKTNNGKNIDSFLETNVTDRGFSIFNIEDKPKNISNERLPQITDPNVEFNTDKMSNTQDKITYSAKGKVFQITTVDYDDDNRKTIKSIQHKRVDDVTIL